MVKVLVESAESGTLEILKLEDKIAEAVGEGVGVTKVKLSTGLQSLLLPDMSSALIRQNHNPSESDGV